MNTCFCLQVCLSALCLSPDKAYPDVPSCLFPWDFWELLYLKKLSSSKLVGGMQDQYGHLLGSRVVAHQTRWLPAEWDQMYECSVNKERERQNLMNQWQRELGYLWIAEGYWKRMIGLMVSDAEAADGHAKVPIMLLLLVLIFVLDLQWAFLHIHFLSCICFVLWGHHSLPFRFCCCKSDITATTCMQLHENANDTSHKYTKYMSLSDDRTFLGCI